ncbi:hypothetical protein SASPL_156046 [Salvia splendens]|uniref:aldehyde dehydrogenase (NAD(+)) n=1 Tax=Salvia splendens TaxID=180675 RepID=A0A8X8VXD3_SALSN|nr:hypothetical protein SASPL_156046 [Salvia splendens]
MAAARRISSLVSRSIPLLRGGKQINGGRGMYRYSTAAAYENPITPPVSVQYDKLLIDGKFVDAASGKTFPTLDPRTGEVIAHVAEGDAEDVNRAVSAARKAFDEGPWPRMTAYGRQKILLRFADLIEKHNDEIAALETWDNGKPFEQSAQIEVPMFARLFRYYAGWTDKIHVGPALACGNTVVLKTAEQTPLSALLVSKLLHEAGLPDGVLNIVSGFGPTAGAALCSHMDVDKIAFTGSTDTGRIVLELAAKSNLKPVTLELGGKSPFIVCEDADVDQAVELAHAALFFNQGNAAVLDLGLTCMKRHRARPSGKPARTPLSWIDGEQFEKILKYIRIGQDAGATLETGGDRHGTKGYYIQPTVFSNVKDDMPIAREEIFGPVQTILKFKDLDEVIQRANNSIYGLAAGVFTHNLDTANTLMRALKVGTVWINCFDTFDATIPFGGYKMSGIGREKGEYGLKNYLQVKAVVTPIKNPAWL